MNTQSSPVHQDLLRISISSAGNGYDESWIKEAQKRGLSNYASTPEALAHYLDKKNVSVFTKTGVLSLTELKSRYEIYLKKYYKTINIEALTLIDMMRKDILPAVTRFELDLKNSLDEDDDLELFDEQSYEFKTVKFIKKNKKLICKAIAKIESLLKDKPQESKAKADFYHDKIIPLMKEIRESADELEKVTGRNYWPMPVYSDLLFGKD